MFSLLSAFDPYDHLGGYILEQLDSNGFNTCLLDRLVENDLSLVDFYAGLLRDSSCDVLRCDSTKEPAIIANFRLYYYDLIRELVSKILSCSLFSLVFLLSLCFFSLDLLLVGRSCLYRESSRYQFIAGITIADLYDLTCFTCSLDILFQNDFHLCYLRFSGSSDQFYFLSLAHGASAFFFFLVKVFLDALPYARQYLCERIVSLHSCRSEVSASAKFFH